MITALYTVAAGQNTADLAVVGFNLNGATVTDVAGNPGDTTGTVINPAGILRVDTSVPTILIATPIAGDNAVNASEAAAGFVISGTTVGADDGADRYGHHPRWHEHRESHLERHGHRRCLSIYVPVGAGPGPCRRRLHGPGERVGRRRQPGPPGDPEPDHGPDRADDRDHGLDHRRQHDQRQ